MARRSAPNVDPIQTNFTAGEFSEVAKARPDLDKYKNGLEKCENFFILEQGALFRRSGTRHVCEVTTSTDEARLVPFEQSTTDAYVLVFEDQNFLVIKDEAQVAGVSITGTVPYLAAEVTDLYWAQSADTMYLCHPDYPVRKLTRQSDTNWTISEMDNLDGPYFLSNTDTTVTVSTSAASGTITVTSSSGIFAATDSTGGSGTGLVDRHIRISDNGGNVGWGRITSYTSATQVTVTVESPMPTGSNYFKWRLGSWSSTSGFPKKVGFIEERLAFANTASQPDVLFVSKSQDYELFSPTEYNEVVADDNGFAYTLPANKVNDIEWLDNAENLGIGTTGSEFIMTATDGGPIVPSNVVARRKTSFGSENVRSVNIESSTLFIQRSGRKLREFLFNVDTSTGSSSFIGEDLTILSSHILREGTKAVDMVYQQQPHSMVHVLRQDGQLATLTINRRQNVFGWGRHILGGSGVAESAAVVPSADQTTDTLYLLVKRTIDGATKRYIEFIEEDFYPDDDQDKEDMFFVDSGLTLSNPSYDATSFSVTGITRSGSTATATTSTAHGKVVGEALTVAGADQSDYNISGVITAVPTTTSFEYTVSGTPTTPATGTITATEALVSGTTYRVIDSTGGDYSGVGGPASPTNGDEFTATSTATPTYGSGSVRKVQSVITGLSHLEGETVQVVGDGGEMPDVTVSSGQITLAVNVAYAQVGLRYTSHAITLPLEAGSMTGTAQGKLKRVDHVGFRVLNSIGLQLGPKDGSLVLQSFRGLVDPMDASPPFYTGDKRYEIEMPHNTTGQYEIKQEQGYPLNVLLLLPEMKTTQK